MSILVIGSTGTLCRQIVRCALNDGYEVKCLVRNLRKAFFLQEWGAELLYGDLSIPETLPDILKDITVIIDASTTRPTDILNMKQIDWEGKLALFQAAEVSQIDLFMFFSLINAEKYPLVPLMQLKSNYENLLGQSNMSHTIFRSMGFFQGLIGQYALPILEKHNIQTRPIFSGNILRHPAFSNLNGKKNNVNKFPNSDYIMRNCLLIGCHQGLKNKEINYIHRIIIKFLKSKSV